MSGVARSQVLIAHASIGNEYSPTFTCPDSHVVLLKAAQLFNTTSAAIRVVLIAGLIPGGGNANLVDLNLAAGATYYWDGWAALNPGQYCAVYTAAAGIYEWVSGAILSGGPQFPIAGAQLGLLSDTSFPDPPPGVPVDYPPRILA
jgi:hypothetical protein